jgi:hypothetical protein
LYELMFMRRRFVLILLISFAVVSSILLAGFLLEENVNSWNSASSAGDSAFNIVVLPVSQILSKTSSTFSDEGNLTIAGVEENLTESTLLVTLSNSDPSNITINSVSVNFNSLMLQEHATIPGNSHIELLLTFSKGLGFGDTYHIGVQTSEGYDAEYYKVIC